MQNSFPFRGRANRSDLSQYHQYKLDEIRGCIGNDGSHLTSIFVSFTEAKKNGMQAHQTFPSLRLMMNERKSVGRRASGATKGILFLMRNGAEQ